MKRRRWALAKFPDPTNVSVGELEAVLAELGAAETKRAVVGDLRGFLAWCRRRGVEHVDPTPLLDPIRLPRRMPSPVAVADLELVLEQAFGQERRAVMLAAFAGLRVSEIAALDHAEVRHDVGVIVVRNGKGGRDDLVPMASRLAAELPEERSGRVFPSWRTGATVSVHIRAAMRRAGVEGRAHDLRHTFGTECARLSGGNLWVTQRLLRHVAASSTERYVLWATSGGEVVDQLYA